MPSAGWCAYMQAQQEKEERARVREARMMEREMQRIQWEAAHRTAERCPRCGSVMYIRDGKHGKFLGCSQYPECKGTRKYTD